MHNKNRTVVVMSQYLCPFIVFMRGLLSFSESNTKMSTRLSYISNPVQSPYMYQTIAERLRCLAKEDADRTAFVFYSIEGNRESITRRTLYQTSKRLAKNFQTLGMQKGSWVGICMNNSINMLYSIFGVCIAGGIPFFLATNLKDGSDVIEHINEMKGEFLIIDASESDQNWDIVEKIWSTGDHLPKSVPTMRCIICNGNGSTPTVGRVSLYDLLNTTAPEGIHLPRVFPEDPLVCFCTSGSTGKPKSVVWSHYGMLNWGQNCEPKLCVSKETVYFCERPFAWAGGFPRLFVTVGCTHVFVDTNVSLSGDCVDQLCDIIQNENVDVAYIPRYIARDLVDSPEQYAQKFSNVKFMVTGGERFPMLLMPLKATLCQTLINWYGNTESGGTIKFHSNMSEDYEEGIIGCPVPGVEVKIVNDSGDVVPFGESGEMCTRCTWRMIAYKTTPELFNKVVDALGWFHTGDIAHIRSDGNIIMDGRSQEQITMQTVKYFPWEIEKDLRKFRGVKEAIAVGVPDVRFNQVICACVVPEFEASLTIETLKQLCDSTFLEKSTSAGLSLKPKYHLLFDSFPLTSSGKLDRRRVSFLAKERLGLWVFSLIHITWLRFVV